MDTDPSIISDYTESQQILPHMNKIWEFSID